MSAAAAGWLGWARHQHQPTRGFGACCDGQFLREPCEQPSKQCQCWSQPPMLPRFLSPTPTWPQGLFLAWRPQLHASSHPAPLIPSLLSVPDNKFDICFHLVGAVCQVWVMNWMWPCSTACSSMRCINKRRGHSCCRRGSKGTWSRVAWTLKPYSSLHFRFGLLFVFLSLIPRVMWKLHEKLRRLKTSVTWRVPEVRRAAGGATAVEAKGGWGGFWMAFKCKHPMPSEGPSKKVPSYVLAGAQTHPFILNSHVGQFLCSAAALHWGMSPWRQPCILPACTPDSPLWAHFPLGSGHKRNCQVKNSSIHVELERTCRREQEMGILCFLHTSVD